MNKKLKNDTSFALSIRHLSVNYDTTPALWDISTDVPSGELIAIMGPNGAGKTTFLKTILGIIPPLAGKVSFFGKPFEDMRKQIAYVPQKESVDWDFPITVRDLVLMGRYGKLGLFRRPKKADLDATEFYLAKVGMLEFAGRQIRKLSGGQQQRIFFARALLQNPDIYFFDEPFAGIDMTTEKVLMEILHGLKKEGKTIFIVHHDLSSVEKYFSWLILLNIRLVVSGPVSQVFHAENLYDTYGKSYNILDKAFRLSQDKLSGLEQ